MAATPGIRPLDPTSARRLCASQVVVDLSATLKELIENAIDAGATKLDITLRDHGLTSIEVADDGHGLDETSLRDIAKKYWTSKISSFEDVANVASFGFRGEALNALAFLGELSITSRQRTPAAGAVPAFSAVYDSHGEAQSVVPSGRDFGTTVTVRSLFKNQPVRHREAVRCRLRNYNRAVAMIRAMACVSCPQLAVRLTHILTTSGQRAKTELIFATSGAGRRATAAAAAGGPAPDLPTATADRAQLLRSIHAAVTGVYGGRFADALEQFTIDIPSDGHTITVIGLISTPNPPAVSVSGMLAAGGGTVSTTTSPSVDPRQHISLNQRLIDLSSMTRAATEAYRTASMTSAANASRATAVPFLGAMLLIEPAALGREVDINVSPDKRTVLLRREAVIVSTFKEYLEQALSASRRTYTVNEPLPLSQFMQATNASSAMLEPKTEAGLPFRGSPTRPSIATTQAWLTEAEPQPKAEPQQHPAGQLLATYDEEREARLSSHASHEEPMDVEATVPAPGRMGSPPAEIIHQETHLDDGTVLTFAMAPARAAPPSAARAPLEPIGRAGPSTGRDARPEPEARGSPEAADLPVPEAVSWVLSAPVREPPPSAGCCPDDDPAGGESESARRPVRPASPGPSDPGSHPKRPRVGPATMPSSGEGSGSMSEPESEPEPQQPVEALLGIGLGAPGGPLGRTASVTTPGSPVPSSCTSDMPSVTLPVHTPPSGSSTGPLRSAFSARPSDQPVARVRVDLGSMSRRLAGLASGSGAPSTDAGAFHYDSVYTHGAGAAGATRAPVAASTHVDPQAGEVRLDAGATGVTSRRERTLRQADFRRMRVLGQFNNGFIIAFLPRAEAEVGGAEGQPNRPSANGASKLQAFGDLFIIDQHAADEKFNYERIRRETRLTPQPLVVPRPLEHLDAIERQLCYQHASTVFRRNGFTFSFQLAPEGDASEPADVESVRLTGQPVLARGQVLGVDDLDDLLRQLSIFSTGGIANMSRSHRASSLSQDAGAAASNGAATEEAAGAGTPEDTSYLAPLPLVLDGLDPEDDMASGFFAGTRVTAASGSNSNPAARWSVPDWRPPTGELEEEDPASVDLEALCSGRARRAFATQACRQSIMIGRALSKKEMTKVVHNLAELVHPWNCPHGRPTLRHLLVLDDAFFRSG
ncbi:hypothetical protein H696_02651 [Fonticula alba]|uniref:DNA mismatch repair protein PMS2 n=1 Tax=Fonticula alba TaxID=691883 RepID=A0A058Z9V7_FONAL|nr:hypothetical protein H696_02651 [Fonticula alba]KCV70322.1 hypothetical protein H696_02651 [Fonticula alba]|eukprot:XP_009494838.1 hypothetical protein H696_02651 [Fonticula alba]